MNWGLIAFIVAILVVVMVHESGHFLVAKAFGFKATQYFVGFGPTIWSFKKGETEYGVKALPLGGFVKIVGMNPYEEVAPEDQPRAYGNKPRWQRALVIVAGSGTHFIVAFLILFVTAMTIGFPTGEATNEIALMETSVEGMPTPARAAGLEVGDRIVGIDGREISSWSEIRKMIRAHGGEELSLDVDREGGRLNLTAKLGWGMFDAEGALVDFAERRSRLRSPKAGEVITGYLGIGPEEEYRKEGFLGAVGRAGYWTAETTRRSFLGIGQTFSMVFGGELWSALQGSGERSVDEGPLGIVGAGRIASDSIESNDPFLLIALIVGFTVFVGLMNLLPLPPLDGGHLAVIAWEAVTGKAVDLRKLIPIAAAVIAFFVILFIAVLYLDLARPVTPF